MTHDKFAELLKNLGMEYITEVHLSLKPVIYNNYICGFVQFTPWDECHHYLVNTKQCKVANSQNLTDFSMLEDSFYWIDLEKCLNEDYIKIILDSWMVKAKNTIIEERKKQINKDFE